MYQLPSYFSELDPNSKQMILVHAAMYEDIEGATVGFLDESRSASSTLALAVRSMASEAAQMLGLYPGDRAVDIGRQEASYRIIRTGYDILRNGKLLRTDRPSKYWDQVTGNYRNIYHSGFTPR